MILTYSRVVKGLHKSFKSTRSWHKFHVFPGKCLSFSTISSNFVKSFLHFKKGSLRIMMRQKAKLWTRYLVQDSVMCVISFCKTTLENRNLFLKSLWKKFKVFLYPSLGSSCCLENNYTFFSNNDWIQAKYEILTFVFCSRTPWSCIGFECSSFCRGYQDWHVSS